MIASKASLVPQPVSSLLLHPVTSSKVCAILFKTPSLAPFTLLYSTVKLTKYLSHEDIQIGTTFKLGKFGLKGKLIE